MSHIPDHSPAGQAERRQIAWRLCLFFAATFMMVGIHVPFWPVWLKDRGFDADDVGMMLFAVSLGRMVAAPVLGMVADRFGSRRRVLIAVSAGLLPVTWAHGQVAGFDGQLGLHLLAGFLIAALIPLGDNLALMAERDKGVDYARARAWGSMGFILTSLGAGLILTGRDTDLVLPILMAVIALLVVAAWALPDLESGLAPHHAPAPGSTGRNLKNLLANPVFVTGIFCSGILQSSHAALYGFASLHWREAGHSETVIGLLWTEGVLVEIALFYAASRYLGHLKSTTLFMIAAAGGMLRWTGLSLFDDLGMLVILQAGHALTFACTHLGAMRFLANNVPQASSATAQSLHAALVGGVFMGGSMWASGRLYESIGGQAFLAMAILSVGGLVLAIVLRALQTRQRGG